MQVPIFLAIILQCKVQVQAKHEVGQDGCRLSRAGAREERAFQ